MTKKQITQKEAKTKYGIVISKMQHYNNCKFYLLKNGNVVDSDGNIRFYKPTQMSKQNKQVKKLICPLCTDKMDYKKSGNTHIWSCPSCPAMLFEFYDDKNTKDLIKYLN